MIGRRSIQPIQQISTEEQITVALRKAIVSGELRPGERLIQERLAREFEVSRIPLRHAFGRLAAEGLVSVDGRRGATVIAFDDQAIGEIYEILELLEVRCIRHAVTNMDDRAALRLAQISKRIEDAEQKLQQNRPTLIRQFYEQLYRESQRPQMAALILRLRDSVDRFGIPHRVPGASTAHRELRKAIENRDADYAADVLTEHLRMIRKSLVRPAGAVSLESEGAGVGE